MTPPTPHLRQSEETPVVSVIMPAYNVARFIGAALDSVFAQTFTNFEVIVVNDGSPDTEELERVLGPYQDRILYFKQENRGVSAARNVGVRAARGTFIAHLDPDDLWEPDYLQAQLAEIERDPSIDVVYPDAFMFGDAPEAGRRYMDWCPSEGEVTIENILRERCHIMGSLLARRAAMLKAGPFDEDLRSCEDFDMWLRILNSGGRIAYHRRVLMRYRRRLDSHTSDVRQLLDSFLRVLDKAERGFDLTPAELEALHDRRNKVRAEAALASGKQAFFLGDTKTAIASIRAANEYFKSARLSFATLFMRLMPRLLLRVYNLRKRPASIRLDALGHEVRS
ncbi:MAG TPA: glycosyltransferase family A protein [Pyrinomonadaceae bacterium]